MVYCIIYPTASCKCYLVPCVISHPSLMILPRDPAAATINDLLPKGLWRPLLEWEIQDNSKHLEKNLTKK